jgi:small subunit ribosomal protein S1
LSENLKVGDIVKGKVVVIADYGAFVEIAPGVEGLIHVSEMTGHSTCTVLRIHERRRRSGSSHLTLDRDERKMSLGIKQTQTRPMGRYEQNIRLQHSYCNCGNFTNFGAFVEIEDGVEGLIHISDLPGRRKSNTRAK